MEKKSNKNWKSHGLRALGVMIAILIALLIFWAWRILHVWDIGPYAEDEVQYTFEASKEVLDIFVEDLSASAKTAGFEVDDLHRKAPLRVVVLTDRIKRNDETSASCSGTEAKNADSMRCRYYADRGLGTERRAKCATPERYALQVMLVKVAEKNHVRIACNGNPPNFH